MDPPEHNVIEELSKTGEDDSTLPQTQLLSTRLALVAAAQPPSSMNNIKLDGNNSRRVSCHIGGQLFSISSTNLQAVTNLGKYGR